MSPHQIVELPKGVKHFAETWEAWDALTTDDGWRQEAWWVKGSRRCDPTEPGAETYVEKIAKIRGHWIVVLPPPKPREKSCSGCGGAGGRGGYSPQGLPDPQTEELCDRCEGSGKEPGR